MLRELVIISLFLTSLLLYFNPPSYNNPPSFLPYNQLFNGTPMSDLLNKLGQSVRAPIGIADYGISPNGPFIRNTTQFLGIVTIYNLTANSTASFAPNSVSFQLNTVLSYISNGRHYAIWTQNVIVYNTLTHNILFVDNLWNFTSLHANITSVKGDGNTSVAKIHDNYIRFYYDYANTTGSNTTVTLPIKIMLLTNVTTNSKGEPVICFWYNDGFGWQKYDEVTITNSPNSSDVYFLVNGFNFTGARTYYDAELIIGGPGDGSCAYILNSYVILQLEYWNGHNFQEVRNTFNFGSDTGETAWGASTKFYYTFSGQPAVLLVSGQQVLSQIWDENQVSTLSIRTDVTSGNITVYLLSNQSLDSYKQSIPFVGGEVVLTLVKGFYGVLVYNSSDDLVGEANVKVNDTNVYVVTIPFNMISENEVTTSNYLVADEVQFKITADGYVNVSFGGNVSFLSPKMQSIFVNGSTLLTITFSAYNFTPGIYAIIINASILPGVYKVHTIKVIVLSNIYPLFITYKTLGSNTTIHVVLYFPNNNYENLTLPIKLLVPKGTEYEVQGVVTYGDVRWITLNSTRGIVNFTTYLTLVYYQQFLVNFSYMVKGNQGGGEPNITYYYAGHLNQSTPGVRWVDSFSHYSYSQLLPGSEKEERWLAYNYSGIVSSPGVILVIYYQQFYINVSPLPFSPIALIDGKNVSLSSTWLNYSTTVTVENLSYYANSGERYLILSVYPSSNFTVNSPLNVTIKYVTQFYVKVVSPIPLFALVNGSNVSFTSGWYNYGDVVHIENLTYYLNYLEREVPVTILPSNLVINSSKVVTVVTVTQYFVLLNSPVPVTLSVNGSKIYALGGVWLNAGSRVEVVSSTFYYSPTERFVVVHASPENFTVNTSTDVNVNVIKEYLVRINNFTEWLPEGYKLKLNATLPFYEIGEFTGNYTVPANVEITVNGSITEKLITKVNFALFGRLVGLVIFPILIVILAKKRRL
ncbi:thermopsin [Stygiolobus azoricus]|uniref:Thermopsin n=1 Tax=Stygiolobus azoricus TaxID=41675 RepID=A0A650CRK0_9CREN|nr:thermopsin [Stygiolobus azoricus]QGR20403.1 hypothetical protein D1868_10685 [Stygiolobus azoricus]